MKQFKFSLIDKYGIDFTTIVLYQEDIFEALSTAAKLRKNEPSTVQIRIEEISNKPRQAFESSSLDS